MTMMPNFRDIWDQVCEIERKSVERNARLLKQLDDLENCVAHMTVRSDQMRRTRNMLQSQSLVQALTMTTSTPKPRIAAALQEGDLRLQPNAVHSQMGRQLVLMSSSKSTQTFTSREIELMDAQKQYTNLPISYKLDKSENEIITPTRKMYVDSPFRRMQSQGELARRRVSFSGVVSASLDFDHQQLDVEASNSSSHDDEDDVTSDVDHHRQTTPIIHVGHVITSSPRRSSSFQSVLQDDSPKLHKRAGSVKLLTRHHDDDHNLTSMTDFKTVDIAKGDVLHKKTIHFQTVDHGALNSDDVVRRKKLDFNTDADEIPHGDDVILHPKLMDLKTLDIDRENTPSGLDDHQHLMEIASKDSDANQPNLDVRPTGTVDVGSSGLGLVEADRVEEHQLKVTINGRVDVQQQGTEGPISSTTEHELIIMDVNRTKILDETTITSRGLDVQVQRTTPASTSYNFGSSSSSTVSNDERILGSKELIDQSPRRDPSEAVHQMLLMSKVHDRRESSLSTGTYPPPPKEIIDPAERTESSPIRQITTHLEADDQDDDDDEIEMQMAVVVQKPATAVPPTSKSAKGATEVDDKILQDRAGATTDRPNLTKKIVERLGLLTVKSPSEKPAEIAVNPSKNDVVGDDGDDDFDFYD